jgi:PIN domain nuclease of toxin-antitoxin system
MRLLLDTHTFLWFVWGSVHLSTAARAIIEDTANQVFVSVASIWEIAIKVGIGKLALAEPMDAFLVIGLDDTDVDLLPIERDHIIQVAALPLHHRDPFDRMLIAQAIVEQVPLVSADPAFDAYSITRIW